MVPSIKSTAVGTKRYRGVLRQIETRFRALFADINRAHKAFGKLAHLAEDMRILSLNAELAAGRAGRRGMAVRALTQYTRGLVTRLVQINANTSGLKSLYGLSTGALRGLRHLWLIESASAQLGTALLSGRGAGAMAGLERVRQRYLDEVGRDLEGIVQSVGRVTLMVRVVDEVVEQAASIATNIATEAVSAGMHEQEFRAVAETMRHYVEELQTMNDEAAQVLRDAEEHSRLLREVTSNLLRQTRGAHLPEEKAA